MSSHVQPYHAHTHPSPSRWAKFVKPPLDLSIEVDLRELTSSPLRSSHDVFYPQIRRTSSVNYQSSVEHLDSSMCWKGIKMDDAAEILLWERIFKSSLEEVVSQKFLQSFWSHLLRSGERLCSLRSRLNEFLLLDDTHEFDIDFDGLVSEMVETYHKTYPFYPSRWIESSYDTLLHNFVRTHDCFLNSPRLQVIFLSCRTIRTGHFRIIGDVVWRTQDMQFADLPHRALIGQKCYLVPYIRRGHHKASWDFGPVYHVASKSLPWAWDAAIQGFQVVVPYMKSQRHPSPLQSFLEKLGNQDLRPPVETILQILHRKYFLDCVSFERVDRFVIKIGIEKAPSPWNPFDAFQPSYSNTPMSKMGEALGSGEEYLDTRIPQAHRERLDVCTQCTPTRDQVEKVRICSSPQILPRRRLSSKRKASEQVPSTTLDILPDSPCQIKLGDLSLSDANTSSIGMTAKRQKLDLVSDLPLSKTRQRWEENVCPQQPDTNMDFNPQMKTNSFGARYETPDDSDSEWDAQFASLLPDTTPGLESSPKKSSISLDFATKCSSTSSRSTNDLGDDRRPVPAYPICLCKRPSRRLGPMRPLFHKAATTDVLCRNITNAILFEEYREGLALPELQMPHLNKKDSVIGSEDNDGRANEMDLPIEPEISAVSQEEIRANYESFLKDKADQVNSPIRSRVDSETRKAFEDAFIGTDDGDWSDVEME